MQNAKEVLKDILGCGYQEVDMLLETEIDVASTVQYITEEGIGLSAYTLFCEAFMNKVCEVFDYDSEKQRDFQIIYNGALDTHIIINNGKWDYYHDNFPEEIEEIESYMNMQFEEGR